MVERFLAQELIIFMDSLIHTYDCYLQFLSILLFNFMQSLIHTTVLEHIIVYAELDSYNSS